jgi:histidine triad (HIT) family protein
MSGVASADCLFCKIVRGEIPSPRVYEDERFICIRDIRPQAKIHLLVLPKKHVAGLDEAFPEKGPSQAELIGELFAAGAKVAHQQGLLPGGFRSVINTGRDGGQTVFHLHLHLMGGESLRDQFG